MEHVDVCVRVRAALLAARVCPPQSECQDPSVRGFGSFSPFRRQHPRVSSDPVILKSVLVLQLV